MRIVTNETGIVLFREHGDKALSHESSVTHHMRRLLNARDGGGWVRFWPDREGMTDCRQGVCNRRKRVYYWHERYAVEAAHKAFNAGAVDYSDMVNDVTISRPYLDVKK